MVDRMQMNELNNKIRNCKKCSLSKTRKQAVCGEGDLNARIILIAQAPGKEEDKDGSMFIGPSREVLDGLLEDARVERDKIYMTNLIKCMLPDYRKPKQDEIEICSKYLDEEIKIVDPDILVPLGYYSTRYLFNKYDISFKKDFAEITGELFLADDRKIFPLAHPASLLYDDSFEEEMREQYERLEVFLEPCKWYQLCPMKQFYEEGRLDKKWVEMYCKGDWKNCVRFQKEKNREYHPDFMLPNGEIDEGLKDQSD